MYARGNGFLKLSFAIGTVADLAVAATWFLIAAGVALPNVLGGYVGSGADYRFAMFIAGLFLAGWGVILGWGYLRPRERRGLLPITALLIFASNVIEVVAFPANVNGGLFLLGALLRAALVAKFMSSYLNSRRHDAKATSEEASG